jgi:hypothetical protein
MKNKKIIFAITLMTLAMSSPASPGGSPLASGPTAGRTPSIGPTLIKQHLMIAAENGPGAAQSQTHTATDQKERTAGPGSKNAENGSKNSEDAAAKPLKPFVPSEKIAAEQAVDFPADI